MKELCLPHVSVFSLKSQRCVSGCGGICVFAYVSIYLFICWEGGRCHRLSLFINEITKAQQHCTRTYLMYKALITFRSAAGFPSDDDDDNTEEEEDEEEDNDDEGTRVGEGSSSTVSADVSVSTPRYNRHPRSPTSSTGRHRQRHQHQQQQQHHQHLHPRPGKDAEGLMFHERPANGEAMAGGRVHPVQPAYHVPDHQQVSLATAVASE